MEKNMSFMVGEKLFEEIHRAAEASDTSVSDWVRRCCEKELNGYSFVSELLGARRQPLKNLLDHALKVMKLQGRSK